MALSRTKPALTSLNQNENSCWSTLARDGIVKGVELIQASQKIFISQCVLAKTHNTTAMDDPVQCHAYGMVIWWTTIDLVIHLKTGRSAEEAVCAVVASASPGSDSCIVS